MVIGVVGPMASGKDTMADYLKKMGFMHESLSDILREIMTMEGEPIDVLNMTKYGNRLRDTKGYGYLAQEALRRVGQNNAVITAIRQVGEIETFRKNRPDFILIKLDAPTEMRYQRLVKRGRAGDVESMDDLKELEEIQNTGQGGAINMGACYKLADETIMNDGTIENLYRKIDDFLEKHKQRG